MYASGVPTSKTCVPKVKPPGSYIGIMDKTADEIHKGLSNNIIIIIIIMEARGG